MLSLIQHQARDDSSEGDKETDYSKIKSDLNMKRLKCLFFLLVLLPCIAKTQTTDAVTKDEKVTTGITWTTGLDWKEVLRKAKAENKYIFVDCYATWCGPCKYMDKNIYPNDTVGRFFNEKFISVKIQMDTSKSDNDFIKGWYADAAMLMNKYKVTAFPSYLFFEPNGEIVHRDAGLRVGIENFVAIGANSLNPKNQYYTALEKYRSNELDTAYMKTLARKVKDVDGVELAEKIANDYINRLPIDALFTKDNIRLMYDFTKSSKERGFTIFKDSAKRINETDRLMTQEVCKYFVWEIIKKEEIKPFIKTKKGKPDWKKIRSNLKKYGFLGEEAFVHYQPEILFKTEIEPELKNGSDWNRISPMIEKLNLGKRAEFVVGSTVVYYLNGVNFYKTEKNCSNLVAAATYYADSFPTFLSAMTLNGWAWTIFEHSVDKEELVKGLAWSKRALELNKEEQYNADFIDTYANILYKLGRTQEAITWQKKAVQLLETTGKDGLEIRKNLEKMQNGERTWPNS